MFSQFLFKPILKPVVRIITGLLAIPIFRFLLRRVFRVQTTDVELERDLEHWFRGAVLLLAGTSNLEQYIFGPIAEEPWVFLLRLLLAIGVIENMPDQDLFGILHRGPPPFRPGRHMLAECWALRREWMIGLAVLHLKRSSPALVIMTVVKGGQPGSLGWSIGWWCYGAAIVQYLIIALVTDRDRAAGLLAAFDRESARQRTDIVRQAAGLSACQTDPPQD